MRRARRKKAIVSNVFYRRNHQIRAREVMLIDHNNHNIGRTDTRRAIDMAAEAGLDLVEVAPGARPPVARILDYSKFVYEKKRREREARKNQKKVEIKTIRLKLKTSEFHRNIQLKKARGWLSAAKKVKVEIRFYGREITYPELGRKIMDGVQEDLEGLFELEARPRMDGRKMIMMLAPNEAAIEQAEKRRLEKIAKGLPPEEEVEEEDDDEEDVEDLDLDEGESESEESESEESEEPESGDDAEASESAEAPDPIEGDDEA